MSALGEQRLQAVFESVSNGFRTDVVLRFGGASLRVEARGEDDTISVASGAATEALPAGTVDVSSQAPWAAYLGRPFGWGWVAVNQQGYCDGILLAFEDLHPVLMLYVIGSSLHVKELIEHPAP